MKINKLMAMVLASVLAIGTVPMINTYADAVPIVTLGADLTDEQKELVLSFFGTTESNAQIIEINNSMERQYLEGKIDDAVIGTRTLSCSYTMPTSAGGIVIRTANLTWVSDGMLANALITAGIENCQVLATAPFPVSGTGALTGIFKAYESSDEGEDLDEDKKNLATEELIVTGQIINEVIDASNGYTAEVVYPTEESGQPVTDGAGEPVAQPFGVQEITEAQILELLNDIKLEIINGHLTEDKVKEIVDKNLQEYKITLTEDTYNRLVEYLTSLSDTDYAKTIKESISNVSDRISSGFDVNFNINLDIDFKTDKNSLDQFWTNVFNWLKFLFGDVAKQATTTANNIFDKVDTSIIQYDKSANGEEIVDTTEIEDIISEDSDTVETEEIISEDSDIVEENRDTDNIPIEEDINTDNTEVEVDE